MIVTKTSGDRVDVGIEVEGDGAFAHDGDRVIGEVETTGDPRHADIVPSTIIFMHVDEDCRCYGIGLELIRALAEEFGMLQAMPKASASSCRTSSTVATDRPL